MEAILKLREKTDMYVPIKAVRNGILLAVVGLGFCFAEDAVANVKVGCEVGKSNVIPCCSGLADVDADEVSEKVCKIIIKSTEKNITDTPMVHIPLEQEEKEMTSSIPRKMATDVITKPDRVVEKPVYTPKKSDVETFLNEENLKPVPAELSMKIVLNGNGGVPETMEYSGTMEEFCIEDYKIQERVRKEFTGWYYDEACTIPFEGIVEHREELYLYAGWKDVPGFVLNENGYVIGYTDVEHILRDGIVVLPNYTDCVGVAAGAFDGVEELICELYIPANIVKIDEAVLEGLDNLLYIEVNPNNPVYYSKDGILYEKAGRKMNIPGGRK